MFRVEPERNHSMDSVILRLPVNTDALIGTLTKRPLGHCNFLNREAPEIAFSIL